MKTVWKFPIQASTKQVLMIPRGYQLLSVKMQDGNPVLWTLVEDTSPKVECSILTFGTGHNMDGYSICPEGGGHLCACKYIDTFQIGTLVFHVFEGSTP